MDVAANMFESYFMAGFECSTQRRRDDRRLDMVSATAHDRLAALDYRAVSRLGLHTVRDGVRWHLIETVPGLYDWSSFLPMLKASAEVGVQVIWDLCHYGLPDWLDIWSPAFVEHFARFAAAVAGLVHAETGSRPVYCPINEISFWSWAGGEVGYIHPCVEGKGADLKRQLVRAAIAAMGAIRAVDNRARFLLAEPLIHISAPAQPRQNQMEAEVHRLSQFEAFDLLSGRLEPELGGNASYLDILGLNFYPHNQWYFGGATIPFGHPDYRPFRELLVEVQARYQRPALIAETGSEGTARPSWLHYVCAEARAARDAGVQLLGICLYPILDYPGWDNDRRCQAGLLGEADITGQRKIYAALLEELRWQQQKEALWTPLLPQEISIEESR
ncbi:beta-glucosidase [Dongia soli]|uniref:Beta-glucosidase n=1 Tax=Dongia soli TaxID=600628 RepID=A0ABU5EFP3_9PROT|nr:beta-glucosidase [Dongia soli]MDY0885152.1 beta-glucosidase [Dongia soli]